MKIDPITTTALRSLLSNCAFNPSNVEISDHIIHADRWEIFFESKHDPVTDLSDAVLLTLTVEDADYLIEKYYDDGIAYGYEYILQIHTDISKRREIEKVLLFIKGWVLTMVKVADIENNLKAA